MRDSSSDDRMRFASDGRAKSIALGKDCAVFDRASGTLTATDAYDQVYLRSWWGLPIIQLPADVMAAQEVMFAARPTVIINPALGLANERLIALLKAERIDVRPFF